MIDKLGGAHKLNRKSFRQELFFIIISFFLSVEIADTEEKWGPVSP